MNNTITRNVARLAVLALAIAASGSALAADATAQATGTVVSPIAITKSADLVFGSFASGASGGTVTVSTLGVRGKTGDVALFGTGAAAAKFDVTGEGGLTYSIVLTPAALTRSGGSETMSFTPQSDSSTGTLAGIGAAGVQSFFVGGVLNVAAAQAPGAYAGSVTATVAYN